MHFIKPASLSNPDKLQSLVEHRNKFSLDFCELNVFETHEKASDFHLTFNGFTVTSMLRGKKVMHLEGKEQFDYLPGETVIAPANSLMRIDFPEANRNNPTQCTALVIDEYYLQKQLSYINERFSGNEVSSNEWKINFQEFMLKNNCQLADLSTKMLMAFRSNDTFKEFQVDIMLRELVLCVLKLQNLSGLQREHTEGNSTKTAFHAVLNYISSQITSDIKVSDLCKVAGMSKSSFYRTFVEAYGITPNQLILEERIKYAKQLMRNGQLTLKEIAFAAGFNDPNYFSRAFKQQTGKSPSSFRKATAQLVA